RRRNVARHATLQRVQPLAFFVARQTARYDRARGRESGKSHAHRRQRDPGFLRNFDIEPLTVLFQALKNFDHEWLPENRVMALHRAAIPVVPRNRTCFRSADRVGRTSCREVDSCSRRDSAPVALKAPGCPCPTQLKTDHAYSATHTVRSLRRCDEEQLHFGLSRSVREN